MLEYDIATENELRLVCNINGSRKSVLDSIVSAKSEYHTIEQYMEFNEVDVYWCSEQESWLDKDDCPNLEVQIQS